MEHKVLARKLRPKKFEMLIGQENAVKILKNIINLNKVHHAILLTGSRGVGKTTIARIIAKALNCSNLINGEPCTECSNCKQIDSGSYIDIIEIDAASNTGVDNVRDLIDNAQYAPIMGKYKIYIIDEVHQLSKSAFNAMLKTLEEPPQFVIFILATTELAKIPATILSRCLQLKLRDLLVNEIATYLAQVLNNENVKFEHQGLNLLAKAAKGSMRDALSLLDQGIAFSEDNNISAQLVSKMLGLTSDEFIYSILHLISKNDVTTLIDEIENHIAQGNQPESILSELQSKLIEVSICQITGKSTNQNIINLAKAISVNDVQLFYEISNIGLSQFNKTSDSYSVFLMTILRMIAFKIGSNNDKNIIINETNYNVSSIIKNDIDEKPQHTIESLSSTIICEQSNSINHEVFEFTNDSWIKLLADNEQNFTYLFPILKGSKLVNYDQQQKIVTLEIDVKYRCDVNEEMINKLTQKLYEFLKQKITVNYEFTEELTQTQDNNIEASIINKNITVTHDVQLKSEDNIVSNSDVNESNLLNCELNQFTNDNWVKLLIDNEKNFGYLFPILKNSKLIKYDKQQITLVIDIKYNGAVNKDMNDKITQKLYEILKQKITIIYEFSEDLVDTLEEKNIEKSILNQNQAESMIKSDQYLDKIIHKFSASIVPASIKSIIK